MHQACHIDFIPDRDCHWATSLVAVTSPNPVCFWHLFDFGRVIVDNILHVWSIGWEDDFGRFGGIGKCYVLSECVSAKIKQDYVKGDLRARKQRNIFAVIEKTSNDLLLNNIASSWINVKISKEFTEKLYSKKINNFEDDRALTRH